MTIEIERKFHLSEIPHADRLGSGVRIRQGYLAEESDVEVRIRLTPNEASLTVKAGAGIARTEVDVPISVQQADELWVHTVGRRLDKTRHRVPLEGGSGLVAEVDVYAGELADLCVVEVEFSSEKESTAFVPPAWFGREVTGEPRWSNAKMARQGRPPDA